MAALSNADRGVVWSDAMRYFSQSGDVLAVKKADLRAAVDALDTFLDTNAATINAAIPQPARGALSASQKALLLSYVIAKRYLRGS